MSDVVEVEGILNACLEKVNIASQTFGVICTHVVNLRDAPDAGYRLVAFNQLCPIMNGLTYTHSQLHAHVESFRGKYKEDLQALHSQISQLNVQNKTALDELQSTKTRNDELVGQNRLLEAKIVQMQSSMDEQRARYVQLQEEAVSEAQKIGILERAQAVNNVLRQAAEMEETLRLQLEELRSEKKGLHEECAGLASRVATMEVSDTQLTARNKELEERLARFLKSHERLTPLPSEDTTEDGTGDVANEGSPIQVEQLLDSALELPSPSAPPPTPYRSHRSPRLPLPDVSMSVTNDEHVECYQRPQRVLRPRTRRRTGSPGMAAAHS